MKGKKFGHLNVPGHWQQYWSRYPEGYTILESLINWVSQVDDMTDNVNGWNDYLDVFVGKFDKELQGTVTGILNAWNKSGFLTDLINEYTNERIDGVEKDFATLHTDKVDRNGVAQIRWANLAQDARENITGGKTATVGVDSVSETNVVNKSIPLTKLSDNHIVGIKTTNLFNKHTAINSKYISSANGNLNTPTLEPITDWNASDWILLKPNTKYIRRHDNQMAFYDGEKKFVSGFGSGTGNKTFTTGANTIYARMTVNKSEIFNEQLNEGSTLQPYEDGYHKVTEHSFSTSLLEGLNYKKIPLIKTSNLFNRASVINSRYISGGDGTEQIPKLLPITDWNASDWIEVKPNTKYSRRYDDQMAQYDVNKSFVVGFGSASGNSTFTTGSTTRYVRMTVKTERLNSEQLNEGGDLLQYESGQDKISPHVLPDSITQNTPGNVLKTPYQVFSEFVENGGKRIKLIGDSITHGMGGTGYAQDGAIIADTAFRTSPNSHSWANSFIDLVGRLGITVINWGISGKNSAFYLENMSKFITNTDDLVIMQIGTNDRHTLTTWEQSASNQIAIVNYCKQLDIPIILMSANPVSVAGDNDAIRNFKMFQVNMAVKQAALYAGVEHINNYDAYMRHEENTGNTVDSLLADGLHPNDKGYDVMFRNIVRSLGISYTRQGITK